MARYRTVNQLSPTDAAYITGLIDGEGTVTLARTHREENRQLAISISSTEGPLLQHLLETTGAGRLPASGLRKNITPRIYLCTL